MELLEAIGKRRSIRFYKSWKKVEDWKIQQILQAARYASCQGNCNSTEALVIDKATYQKKKLDEILGFQLITIHNIYFMNNLMDYIRKGINNDNLEEAEKQWFLN